MGAMQVSCTLSTVTLILTQFLPPMVSQFTTCGVIGPKFLPVTVTSSPAVTLLVELMITGVDAKSKAKVRRTSGSDSKLALSRTVSEKVRTVELDTALMGGGGGRIRPVLATSVATSTVETHKSADKLT
jgi:hypothetical protein